MTGGRKALEPAILAETRRQVEDVVGVLLELATLEHMTGDYRSRDGSIESAAGLIAQCGRLRRGRSTTAITVSRLPS